MGTVLSEVNLLAPVAADALLTPAEVAELLRVPTSWVYSHQRELPGHLRLGRKVRFRRNDILQLIRGKETCQ